MIAAGRLSVLAIVAVAVSCVGCGKHPERAYGSLSEMNGTGDEPILAMTAVPADAANIKVMTSIESGEYYISYQTSDVLWSPGVLGMSVVEGREREYSIGTLGFGVKLPLDVKVQVRCREEARMSMPGVLEDSQMLFVADGHSRQHQWNVKYDDKLKMKLCNPIRRSVPREGAER